jgi:exopolysaccharide production protein ExoZ
MIVTPVVKKEIYKMNIDTPSSTAKERLLSLQILRFVAATLVVLAHIGDRLDGFASRYSVDVNFVNFSGRLGVEIFFIISGFIMGYISIEKFGAKKAPVTFLAERAMRIVPMYWICLAFMLFWDQIATTIGSATLQPDYFINAVKSFAFIPYLNEVGSHRPILGQGWTLNYEMFFYALFAASLFFARRIGIPLLAIMFIVLSCLHYLVDLPVIMQIWTDPIILLFLVGFLLAIVRSKMNRLTKLPGQALVCLLPIFAYTAIWSDGGAPPMAGPISAFFCVAICVLFRGETGGSRVANIAAHLGDASYSLYLTHGFVLLFTGIFWRKAFGGEHLWIYTGTVVVLSFIVAHFAYKLLERPASQYLRSRISSRLLKPSSVDSTLKCITPKQL